ncbi:MAG: alpha/beta hydrolase [Bacteroidales bacterium]|nr:alpha/beta hydrolase [Bacteroidales bacterium]
MNRFLAIFVPVFLLAAPFSVAQGIKGSWKGELDFVSSKLAVVFHFDGDGCTMDSPDQGAKDIPAEVGFVSADSVSISNRQLDMAFSGKLQDGKIVGRFSQRGLSMPLVLTPGEFVRNRPQTPEPPFPYRLEDVSFSNGDAVLSGTLVYPEGWNGRKKVPVALMVSGSGLQNRDEELLGHKPFLVIADFLARNGIATLRYDDRGAGTSTGDAANATTEDFMKDADAGLDYLRSLGKFRKIGVIGHSEGGEIAFMLASRGRTDFIVSLAGPGVQGDSILLLQNLNALRQAGSPMTVTKEFVRASVKSQNNPWLDYFMDYDPADDISGIRCPALILNGDRDVQVEAAVNIPSIESNLPRNRRGKYVSKHTEVKVYPGLNHLFQHCATGRPFEYKDIEEIVAPEVLEDISRWIAKLK